MIYVFLGPPGSGKGTQAKRLAAKENIPHIALGDILREAVRKGTEVGVVAKQFIDAGNLVPDEVTIRLTDERIKEDDCRNGFILDGFPRSLRQLEALDGMLKGKEYTVVYFSVPLTVVVDRNCGRLSCPKCGAVYHVKYNPPKKDKVCDKCGGELFVRKDDNAEVIENRFTVYERATEPLIKLYEGKGRLKKIDADGAIDAVFTRLVQALGL